MMDSIRYLTMHNWRWLRWWQRLAMLSHWRRYIQPLDAFSIATLAHSNDESRQLKPCSKQNREWIFWNTRGRVCFIFQSNWLFATSQNDENYLASLQFRFSFLIILQRECAPSTAENEKMRKSNSIVNFVCHPRLATNNSTYHLKRVSFPFVVRFSVVGNTSVKHGWFFVLVGNLLINQTKHGVNMFFKNDRTGRGRTEIEADGNLYTAKRLFDVANDFASH